MNRNQRRKKLSQDKVKPLICFKSKLYTIEEANMLAIKEHILKNYQTAVEIYDLVIATAPDHTAACNNRGVSLQEMKRYDDALASFNKTIALKPNSAETYNNRGATLNALKQYDEALASYDKALSLKADYGEASYNRANVLQKMKQYDEALASYDKAMVLMPSCAEVYYNRGITLKKLKRYYIALKSYDQAIALKPDHAEAYNNRGAVLHEMKQYDDALASYDKAIFLKPDHAEAYNNRGITLQEMKRYDEALANYDQAIALKPDHAEAYNNRGSTLVNKGDMQEAEKMFRISLAIKPSFPSPLYGLTKICQYRDADHADIERIKTLLDNPANSSSDREYFYFSLGKMYDDCGCYDEAFESYRQANLIRNAAASYKPNVITQFTTSIIRVFSKEFLAQPFAFASDSRSPLFIVGMPRSGTTLMASILSNHPSIASAGELPTIIELTSRLPGLIAIVMPYPQAVEHITPAIASGLINDYERRLRRDTGSDATYVIDKHPLNCARLGFISMLFPHSHIIHCKRDPLDTCLSNYFQRFSMDYNYSFDLRNTGHFYGEYAKLMEHWRNVLPTQMIEVSYEDMVLNTEQVARKTLARLGLEWDERCLVPHTNPYAVETASNWQVRQPIYSQSIGRWRHYEKHLAPLKEALQT